MKNLTAITKNIFFFFLLLILCPELLSAGPVDIASSTIFLRRGFDTQWINQSPEVGDKKWTAFRPLKEGKRSIIIKELPDSPERTFLSFKNYPAQSYTFMTEFTIKKENFPFKKIQAFYSANMGENWAVYLNGKLLHSEIHLNNEGEIEEFRHIREILLPIDSHFFRVGINTLAIRIIGDPTNIDSGFHRSVPFSIVNYKEKNNKISETGALILMFLYLFFGIYRIFIYSHQTWNKYNLFYGAFSILLFLYLFSRSQMVYSLTMDSTLLHRIEYAALFALLPVIGAFFDNLIAGSYSIVTKIFTFFYSLLIVVILMPISNTFAIDILRIWQISAIVPLFYYTFFRIAFPVVSYFHVVYFDYRKDRFPVKILKASWRTLTRSTAGNLLLGTLIMLACALFDILDSIFWSYEIVLTRYGFFIFMAGITLILANRFLILQQELLRASELNRFELKLATDVQLSLLPVAPENLEDWDIALSYIPKYGASGDCYDFYIKENELKGISIFDVSGHGTAAALIAMITKPIARRLFNRMEKAPLNKIVQKINHNVSGEISNLDHFVSGILLRFNGKEVEYTNSGHPDLLMRQSDSGEVISVGEGQEHYRGELLGANISNAPPRVISFPIDTGDVLIAYTDGIIEGSNFENIRYGIKRLKKTFKKAPDKSAKEILDFILEDFFTFMNLSDVDDDFTLIVARKK